MLAIQQLRERFKFRNGWLSRSRESTFSDGELPAQLLHPDEYMYYTLQQMSSTKTVVVTMVDIMVVFFIIFVTGS